MTTGIVNETSSADAAAPDLSDLADQLVSAARSSGVELTGPGGLFTTIAPIIGTPRIAAATGNIVNALAVAIEVAEADAQRQA